MKLFYISLAVFFIGGAFVEYFLTKDKYPNYYNLKDLFNSIKLGLMGLVLDLGVKVLTFYLLYQMQPYAFFELGFKWWVWLLCFVAWDFIFYFMHLAEHRVRFLWATHVNHHSSPYLNLSTALRSAVLKSFYRYFFFVPMILVGFPFEMFLVIYALGKFWAFFSHSQLIGKLGILESFLVTPSHHRVHHSCNDNHLDRNFGETLIIWDKLFGTFKEEKEELIYGITEAVDHQNIMNTAFHEFHNMLEDVKDAKGLKNKISYVIKKPGWKPQDLDNNDKVSININNQIS